MNNFVRTPLLNYRILSTVHINSFQCSVCPRKQFQLTCKIVKFSNTLFIIYFSGKCLSLWMKLIIYSHMGDRWMRYTNRPFSKRAYSVSTFSTTCLPNEHTFVEHVIVIFSGLSYLWKDKECINKLCYNLWVKE